MAFSYQHTEMIYKDQGGKPQKDTISKIAFVLLHCSIKYSQRVCAFRKSNIVLFVKGVYSARFGQEYTCISIIHSAIE